MIAGRFWGLKFKVADSGLFDSCFNWALPILE